MAFSTPIVKIISVFPKAIANGVWKYAAHAIDPTLRGLLDVGRNGSAAIEIQQKRYMISHVDSALRE